MSIANRIRFLAACHQADNRETAIFDVFHNDVRHRHFAAGTEVLASGLQDALAIPLEAGLQGLKAATMYKRERTLVYASLLVAGTTSSGRKIAAPLLYFPASLERYEVSGEEVTALRIRAEEQCLNFPLFAELAGGGDDVTNAIESMLRKFPRVPFVDTSFADIVGLLRDFFPDLRLDELHGFPSLVSEKVVRARTREGHLTCLPAALMALVPNPRSTRGVLFELSEVADQQVHSPPVRALFTSADPAVIPEEDHLGTVPAVLSKAQQKIVRSARSHPLTLVVGPPGTGKSYTVSALALDHVLRGESVLIACRTERAIDVIEKKLASLLGETTPILRGGSGDYRKKLKAFLERLLDSGLDDELDQAPASYRKRLEKSIRRLEKTYQLLAKRNEREVIWGRLATRRESLSWLETLRLRYLDWRLGGLPRLWKIVETMEEDLEERISLATSLLRASRRTTIEELLRQHRKQLKWFQGAIRARTSARQEKLFSEMDLSLLMKAFPLWMCSFKELSRFAPLERELFDIVIVDEATQSDMASPIPALYRARRAVVTGDPRQLRHVSFLARERQRALAQEAGLSDDELSTLDYRDRSLLDLVDDALVSQQQVAFLDEHFRSLPSIIAFSNREFYGGRLRVMTARPETERRGGIELRRIEGKRDANGVNAAEAEAVVEEVMSWVERERALSGALCHSIGVLSPLRDQAEHLSARIAKKLPFESIEKHDILVATAYGFQGEERDVMMLSLAVDAETHPSALRYLNQPDVFNVAITRARSRQIIFASIETDRAQENTLLARYLSFVTLGASVTHAKGSKRDVGDDFLDEVMARLGERGCALFPTYTVAGMVVDLLVEKDRSLGIDLIGHPGELAPAIERERYLMLRRAGLPVFPLPLFAWRTSPDACVAAILRRVEEDGARDRRVTESSRSRPG